MNKVQLFYFFFNLFFLFLGGVLGWGGGGGFLFYERSQLKLSCYTWFVLHVGDSSWNREYIVNKFTMNKVQLFYVFMYLFIFLFYLFFSFFFGGGCWGGGGGAFFFYERSQLKLSCYTWFVLHVGDSSWNREYIVNKFTMNKVQLFYVFIFFLFYLFFSFFGGVLGWGGGGGFLFYERSQLKLSCYTWFVLHVGDSSWNREYIVNKFTMNKVQLFLCIYFFIFLFFLFHLFFSFFLGGVLGWGGGLSFFMKDLSWNCRVTRDSCCTLGTVRGTESTL